MTTSPRPRCPTHDLAMRRVYTRRGANGDLTPVACAWECPECVVHQPHDLDALITYLEAHGDLEPDWTSLPTYGGQDPVDTDGVWSWDETRLLVGDSDDLRLVQRGEPVECGYCTEYLGDARVDDDAQALLVAHRRARPDCARQHALATA